MSEVRRVYRLTHLEKPLEPGTKAALRGDYFRTRLRFELVPNCDKHLLWANFKVEVVEEVYLPESGAIVEHRFRGSPSVRWKYGPKCTHIEYFCILLCSGLCRHEIVGKTAERAVYDMFWQGMLSHLEFREWIREIAPDWWKIVEEHVEKEKRVELTD